MSDKGEYMELNFKKIQQMNCQEIYEFLLPTINSIYQSFKYVGISQQGYHELVLKEIENSKKLIIMIHLILIF